MYSASDNASGWDREAVHVSQDGSKITKDDDGEQLEVSKKVGNTSSGESYSGTGEEHSQETNSSNGGILVLEDGSVWDVADADQATASVWTDAGGSTSATKNQAAAGATSSRTKTTTRP